MHAFHSWAGDLVAWIDPYLWFWLSGIAFLLGLINTHPLDHDKDATFRDVVLVYLRKVGLVFFPLLAIVFPLLAWMFYAGEAQLTWSATFSSFVTWYLTMKWRWLWIVGWYAVAFLIRFYVHRYLTPALSNMKRKLRVNQETEELSDIREEKDKYEPKLYHPEDYYRNGYVLLGLDGKNQPIYISLEDWWEIHMQIIGATRVGKGVLFGMLIDQAIMRGDTVFYIDPKGDKFIPHIMAERARRTGRKFYYCDLNDPTLDEPNPGEWAPFVGGDARSRRDRMIHAFGLADTGEQADFYKGVERKLLDSVLEKTNGRLNLMLKEFENDEYLKEHGKRLHSAIAQWAQIKSLCPKSKSGLSIEKCLLRNAVVYIKGSIHDEVVVNASRIFVMECIQEIRRLRNQRTTHVTLFLDELRFLISPPVVTALATIASENANVVIAYQSKNDVLNLNDKTLNAKSIEQSINTNCQLKLIYGSQDPETNKWASDMSGARLKMTTRLEHTKVGHLGEETWDKSRTVGMQEEAYITPNAMFSLKKRVGVLFQPRELAQIVYTSFVPVEKNYEFIQSDVFKNTIKESEKQEVEEVS
jgi:hypothetical protein